MDTQSRIYLCAHPKFGRRSVGPIKPLNFKTHELTIPGGVEKGVREGRSEDEREGRGGGRGKEARKERETVCEVGWGSSKCVCVYVCVPFSLQSSQWVCVFSSLLLHSSQFSCYTRPSVVPPPWVARHTLAPRVSASAVSIRMLHIIVKNKWKAKGRSDQRGPGSTPLRISTYSSPYIPLFPATFRSHGYV